MFFDIICNTQYVTFNIYICTMYFSMYNAQPVICKIIYIYAEETLLNTYNISHIKSNILYIICYILYNFKIMHYINIYTYMCFVQHMSCNICLSRDSAGKGSGNSGFMCHAFLGCFFSHGVSASNAAHKTIAGAEGFFPLNHLKKGQIGKGPEPHVLVRGMGEV